jgi:DNA-binding CsgD family transcriptional regulator
MWVERNGPKVVWYQDGFSSEARGAFLSGLYRSDPAYAFALTAPIDVPGANNDFAPPEVYEQSEIARVLLREDVLARARVVVMRNARHIAWVSFGHRRSEGPIGRKDLQILKNLGPHVRRAIQLATRLRSMEDNVGTLVDVLDRMEYGVFLVDETLRVTYFNAEGKRLVRDAGVLVLRHKMLTASASSESATLLRLLQGAVQTAKGEGAETGGSLTLHDAEGCSRLYLDVTPLRAGPVSSDKTGYTPRAMIVARVPDASVTVRPEALCERFSLSPAEARLAVDLAHGAPLKDIAQRRGLAFGTVRAQLASIFDKTGVHRQSELVKVVMGVSSGLVELRPSAQSRPIHTRLG